MGMPSKQASKQASKHERLQFLNCVLNGSAVDCKVSAEDKKCFAL
jgi:hypothetical protein